MSTRRITLMLILTLLVPQVKADYQLEIKVHGFTLIRDECIECNFKDFTERQQRCDLARYDKCDLFFSLCRRELATSSDSSQCPEGEIETPLTMFNIVPGYQFSYSSYWPRFLGLKNPTVFSGYEWEGVQLYVETRDRDFIDPNDLVDTLAIDVDIPVGGSISRTTYTGRFNNAQVDLSFRVVCAENYYGPDCTRLCDDSSCPCEPDYTGEFCETEIEDCVVFEDSRCNNNGTCKYDNEEDLYVCECCAPTKSTGNCNSAFCTNNGNCTVGTDNSYACICNTEYTGAHCEIPIGGCYDNCSGNGECVYVRTSSGSSSYRCFCYPGFTGVSCEQANIQSGTPSSSDTSAAGSDTGSIVGGILGALLLITFLTVVSLVVFGTLVVLSRRKRKGTDVQSDYDMALVQVGDNPVYDAAPNSTEMMSMSTHYYSQVDTPGMCTALAPMPASGNPHSCQGGCGHTVPFDPATRQEQEQLSSATTNSCHSNSGRRKNREEDGNNDTCTMSEEEREFQNPIYVACNEQQ